MGASAVPANAPTYGAPTAAGKAQFAPSAEAAAWTLGHLLFHARAPPHAWHQWLNRSWRRRNFTA
jgi:hypothetical protein